jgi:hypothetical protein
MADETVGQLAELYLGNILYAIELAAVSLEAQGRGDDAAFYRGIARKLAEAHGTARAEGGGRGAESRQPGAESREQTAESGRAEDFLPGGSY